MASPERDECPAGLKQRRSSDRLDEAGLAAVRPAEIGVPATDGEPFGAHRGAAVRSRGAPRKVYRQRMAQPLLRGGRDPWTTAWDEGLPEICVRGQLPHRRNPNARIAPVSTLGERASE
jgi:hypothetical protein